MKPVIWLVSILFSLTCAKNVEIREDGLVKIYWDLNGMKQDDPELIQIIKEEILVPPDGAKLNLTYEPSAKAIKGQYGQVNDAERILKIKENKKTGFFIEAGAACGEYISNTLYFELLYGWTGLLVEPDPNMLKQLYTKHRNAWIFPHCLSTSVGTG